MYKTDHGADDADGGCKAAGSFEKFYGMFLVVFT